MAAEGARLTVRGALAEGGLRFEAQVRVAAPGGTVTAGDDGTLTVAGADSAWFVLAAGTDYADTHPGYRGADPHRAVTEAVDAAARERYPSLVTRHVRDHRRLFDGMSLDLGGQATAEEPTDRLLARYTGGDSPADRALETPYVHGLFTATLEAARELGDDPAFRDHLQRALDALDPGLRIGS